MLQVRCAPVFTAEKNCVCIEALHESVELCLRVNRFSRNYIQNASPSHTTTLPSFEKSAEKTSSVINSCLNLCPLKTPNCSMSVQDVLYFNLLTYKQHHKESPNILRSSRGQSKALRGAEACFFGMVVMTGKFFF